jgi:hypothetical protein
MNMRLKTALIVIAACTSASAAVAGPPQPWCPTPHTPFYLPCK